jgi:Mrp family chromosome partitioning ATPase
MGKTLDILKISEARKERPQAAPEPAPRHDQVHVTDWTLQQEEVPFVEVGPKLFEASAKIMAMTHASQKLQGPHAPIRQEMARTAPTFVEPKPMTVNYETAEPAIARGEVAPEIIAYRQPDHPIAKQYAELLDRMLQGTTGQGGRVLLLTGLRPHVGASTCLLNLSVVASRRPHCRVAAIDAQERQADLAAKLGLTPKTGIEDAMSGTSALQQAVLASPIANLDLLPSGGQRIDAGLRGEALGWIVAWMRERYDLILIDGPSVEHANELASLAGIADATYLVSPESDSPAARRAAAATIARLGGNLRGMLHTHFE